MKVKILLLILSGIFCMSCDHISDEERLIEVKNGVFVPEESQDEQPSDIQNTEIVKNVLLEDFTGQRCSNCPKGTEIIEQLQQTYGERLIAVCIHGGPLGYKGTTTIKGLATEVGDEYYRHWNFEYQPVGIIGRGNAVNYTDWITAVRQVAEQTSEIFMDVEAVLNESCIDITIISKELNVHYEGWLQVWVVEDGITAIQTMPDGTNKLDYVHNHVLRTPVNGMWGEKIIIDKDAPQKTIIRQPLASEWNIQNVSIIAFVYNNYGVAQVVRTKVEI